MATGTTILDFGADPGKSMASVDVSDGAILADSRVEAWVSLAAATAEHSIDEHRVETLKLTAGNIVAGVGFTVYGEVDKGSTWGTFNADWVWA